LIHLIDVFFDIIEDTKIFIIDKNREEVYFFLGKKGLLCINKADNRVLYNLNSNQIQIQIISPVNFALTIEGVTLFFSQETEDKNLFKGVFLSENKKGEALPQEKYRYRAFCDLCVSKKCSQYDTINGRNFKFGGGTISEDMLAQHDSYCEKKIVKFQCIDKQIPSFQQEVDKQ